MNVGKLSLQTFFRKKLLKQKTTYIKNLFPSWLNRSEAHVMLFCGKTCPWHCGKNEIVWIYLNSLCHTRTPKHQNRCFSWHHEWKRETINHLNIFIHLMKDAIKWLFRWRNVFVRQVISFEMFVYYQYILQRFLLRKLYSSASW